MTEKSPAFERLDGAINYAIMTKSTLVKIPMDAALEIRIQVDKQLNPLWPRREMTDIGQAKGSYIKYHCGDCRGEIRPGNNFCWHCGRKVLWDETD